jgi:hypothetical protein
MTPKKAHKVRKYFFLICRNPQHPIRYRNAIHRTAYHYRIPYNHVHAALLGAQKVTA